MAEDRKAPDSSSSTGFDPAAAAVALGAASHEQADEFLREQSALVRKQSALTDLQMEQVRLQNENLRDVDRFELSHLRWQQLSDRMRGLLQVLVALVIGGVLAGATALVWNASHDHDLIVDAFAVPPDIAQTGLTGTALANRVLDRYAEIQHNGGGLIGETVAYRHTGDEVHLQIPEAGVSLGEINRYLRAWLGHDIHVSGELVHTAKGLALTLRYGDKPAKSFAGSANDIGALVKKAGDHLFAAAQPYSYAVYLTSNGHFAEAKAFIPPLMISGTPNQRARAYVTWAAYYAFQGDFERAAKFDGLAARIDPHSLLAHFFLAMTGRDVAHEEMTQVNARLGLRDLHRTGAALLGSDFRTAHLYFYVFRDEVTGDWTGEIAALRKLREVRGGAVSRLIAAEAHDHGLAAARALVAQVPAHEPDGKPNMDRLWARMEIAFAARDWQRTIRLANHLLSAAPPEAKRSFEMHQARTERAYALAERGDIKGAEALIDKTPMDCDVCVRTRGRIASIKHDWKGAAHWLAMVSKRAPHIPFSDFQWGKMEMAKGDLDAAIAKFESAHRKGPHYADPLEYWGEALIARNRSDLALAKFEEAAKDAPKWGRLHMKWGEALLWTGDKAGARKQFAIAAKLYLTPAGKSQLAKVRHG